MPSEWERTKWEQLNQRSRWYSAQLWYVPFAFIGLFGFIIDKLNNLKYPLNCGSFIFTSLLLLAIFIHVVALRHYEIKAVYYMRQIENTSKVSSGGSCWYLSFSNYIKLFVSFTSVTVFWYAMYLIQITGLSKTILIWVPTGVIIVIYIFLFIVDERRNRCYLKENRAKSECKRSKS